MHEKFNDFKLNQEIKQIDGLFSLNDLHKVSGGLAKHKPSNFMRNEETLAMIEEINSENSHFSNMSSEIKSIAYRVINGGKNRGTYVCKELIYTLLAT